MKYIIGIGFATNRGKTTLTNCLIKNLPNCCVVHQDDFFKPQDQIEVGEDGFKQYDVITVGRHDECDLRMAGESNEV
uniref:Muscle-specific beta 1 integrin binding protein 2 n=1 Tax=Acanthochromis polyacanthus TaxID=80966 RepID=A0A3Q1GTT3_9TELE